MHYGHGCDPCYPGYGYPTAVAPAAVGPVGGYGYGGGFALIVVLFILLIIIGASFYGKGCC
ncbi:YjcZ family sporulation protein [Robertmurraya korlensis]|jgi:uncharacterized protein (TIGR01732 family)|uniref:YjcZ family sporulation protein n=1 Tax=Robertmurraya korlensis TaxID=519977 RepID=UPI0008264880|nr:YjcZ family sporulation protein [Robertmurraya korlensis]